MIIIRKTDEKEIQYKKVLSILKGNTINESKSKDSGTCQEIVISSMMSKVLLIEHDDFMLITALATEQALRTAEVMGAESIIITGGQKSSAKMRELALEFDITLMETIYDIEKTLGLLKENMLITEEAR